MANTTSEHVVPTVRSAGSRTGEASEARAVFITGLKNAHAMENQALSIMKPQLERIESYPEVAARLREHISETEGQRDRLHQILEQLGEDPSGFKDLAMSMMGGMSAMTHAMAGDEILKNSMADYAFEHYEIAAYKSLIGLARQCGETEWLPMLEQSLKEETAMAEWLDRNLEGVTSKYISMREAGADAKH